MKLLRLFTACCLLAVGTLAEGIQGKNGAGVLIVGGRSVKEGEVPYHLSLLKSEAEYGASCGGVLVEVAGHQVGLTSSNCFANDNASVSWDVVTGYTSLYYLDDAQRIPVEKIVKHPNYQVGVVTNDLAIMFFQPFVINATSQTIPLPAAGQATPEGSMTISGWGSSSFGETQPYNLKVLNVTVVDNSVCQQDFGNDLEGVYCAQSEEANASPYIGDEGGPAVSIEGGYVSGIFIKADQNTSAIFTDVAYFMNWIDTEVKEYYENYIPPSTTPTTTLPSTTPTTTPPSTAPTTTPSPSTLPPISSTSPPVTTTTATPPTSTNTPSPSTNSTTLDPSTDSTTLDPSTNSTTPSTSSKPTDSTENSSPNSGHRQNNLPFVLVGLLLLITVLGVKYITPY